MKQRIEQGLADIEAGHTIHHERVKAELLGNGDNGECGKFFRDNAKLHLPVYLDDDVERYLQERARSKGVEITRLVNEMLKQDIKLIEAVK